MPWNLGDHIAETVTGIFDMSMGRRPLSPHLQVYKPEFTSGLSIFHRITGLALAAGTLLLVCWLFAVAGDGQSFKAMQAFWGTVVGRSLLVAWSFSLFYHLCNGVRHLFWDAGKGFELVTARRTAVAVVAASIGLTAAAWAWAFVIIGGSK
jgi:succinate dehydrogenase / fumarate reductase cytochrome b subunit